MTKRSQFAGPSRQLLWCATAVLALTGSVFAQSANSGAAKPAAATTDDGGYSSWEFTPFVGWQWFQAFQGQNQRNYADYFKSGWLFGERISANFTPHFGVEDSMSLGGNSLNLKPAGQQGFERVGTLNLQISIDLVYHFQPRTAKNQFFVLGGPVGVWYKPHGTYNDVSATLFSLPAPNMKTSVEPGFNYGIGLKHYVDKNWGLRFDLGGRLNPAAHFGLPSGPLGPGSIYIPAKGFDSSLQASVGVIFREGWKEPPAPPNPLVTQSLRVDVAAAPTGAPTVAGAHDVCPGDDLRLTVNAAGFPNPTYAWRVNGTAAAGATGTSFSVPTATGTGARAVTAVVSTSATGTSAPFATSAGHTYHLTADVPALGGRPATYQWLVNDQPVAGATSSSYDLPDAPAKAVSVRVTVQAPPVTSAAANFTIRALTPPTLTFAVNPTTVPYTSGPIALAAVATPSQCGGAVTVRYSGEGVTGSTFNPGSVSGFDMGNRIRQQTHAVTITATATDAKGQTVSRPANVTVTLSPEARRLDDVVFQSKSARVNNCGKRLLLEELTPMLRNDPGAKVILIGHRDEKEKGSKAILDLDTTRVLNTAAVLSAGKGVCPQLDLSRIMMKAVGTDQSSTPRPALCGSSTNVKEKSGQAVKESDKNAEYRRVEVWFVPSGAADPAGVTGLTPVPTADVQKLGCPK